MERKVRTLELLSPAANAEIAMEAVRHGADAVYIGAESHGARRSASNTIQEIARVVEFAHQYRSKVYVTVNTIVYENELMIVERLCRNLYRAGVDALIVQDMSLLRLDLPDIPLHASTQCDIRTPEKARFLQDAGFSQLVLARELTIPEIRRIVEAVDVPVECFIHGALCVSYSGRCHASCQSTGRSANRGECSQLCRLPYTLIDGNGEVVCRDRHLLSMRDFNATDILPELIEAGVSSFKIEGRLKECDYVKNVTAHYSGLLNRYVSQNQGRYRRSSYGDVALNFEPNPGKSFNRGFTQYFLRERKPPHIASLLTPKSMGELIIDITTLHNGDGISFFDRNGEYQGVNVNKVERGKIIPARKVEIPKGAEIHRTSDIQWQKMMAGKTADRRIRVDISLDKTGVTAKDERGVMVRLPLDFNCEKSRRPMDYQSEFAKLGNTIYRLREYDSNLPSDTFIPRSIIGELRRRIVESLNKGNRATYPYDRRRRENPEAKFPYEALDFRDNVANSAAERFYRDHGVKKIERAMEVNPVKRAGGVVVMTTRHCILRELGMCRKKSGKKICGPLTLKGGNRTFTLRFNCRDCEMEVVS